MRIAWISELKPYEVALPNETEFRTDASRFTLHFGTWKREVNVKFVKELQPDTIGLPEQWRQIGLFPDSIPYEVYRDAEGLHMGPIIALLVGKQKELTPELLARYKDYGMEYSKLRGLIYICSVNGIRPKNKTIDGYYYAPQADGKIQWRKGTFPYPDACYRRIWVSKNKLYDDLLIQTKRKVFNSFFFNKWELWEALKTDSLIRNHLPQTKLLTRMQDIKDMLDLYESIYLKPVRSSLGRGIKKMTRLSTGYQVINRNNSKILVKNRNSAQKYLQRLKKEGPYLIQQPIPFNYQNKQVDFRVIMQKDGSEQWTCSGVIARFGINGRFYTNDVSSICPGEEALRTVYGLNDEEVSQKKDEIEAICARSCQVMEQKYGLFGDVGFDVIMDMNKKVWLLEINNCHNHTIPSYLGENQGMYRTVITRPLEYAKSLAGFTPDKLYL